MSTLNEEQRKLATKLLIEQTDVFAMKTSVAFQTDVLKR
jgi:hypothetical protein